MSALYMGTGNLEKYLMQKLSSKLRSEQSLKVTLLFDFMRGTRITKDGSSSLDLMIPMKREFFKDSLRVGFWHHPDTGLLKGKYAQAQPLREIFGVHHIKAHVFDNNVMITGANLSEDYFTDRQDRCMVIQDCEPLADWFDDLISVLTDCSLNLTENGFLKMLENFASPEKDAKAFKEQMSHHLRFFRFNHKTNVEVAAGQESSLTIDEFFRSPASTPADDDFEHHLLAK